MAILDDRQVDIKALRDHLEWSQEELAAHLKVSLKTIQRWERGESTPRISFRKSLEDLEKREGNQRKADRAAQVVDIMKATLGRALVPDEMKGRLGYVFFARTLAQQLELEEQLAEGDVVVIVLGQFKTEMVDEILESVARNVHKGVPYVYPYYSADEKSDRVERLKKGLAGWVGEKLFPAKVHFVRITGDRAATGEITSNRIIYLYKDGTSRGFLQMPYSIPCYVELESEQVSDTLSALGLARDAQTLRRDIQMTH